MKNSFYEIIMLDSKFAMQPIATHIEMELHKTYFSALKYFSTLECFYGSLCYLKGLFINIYDTFQLIILHNMLYIIAPHSQLLFLQTHTYTQLIHILSLTLFFQQ